MVIWLSQPIIQQMHVEVFVFVVILTRNGLFEEHHDIHVIVLDNEAHQSLAGICILLCLGKPLIPLSNAVLEHALEAGWCLVVLAFHAVGKVSRAYQVPENRIV